MLFAVAAYTMWGFAPLYFKAIDAIPAGEILMHRIIWSALVLCVLIVGLRQIGKVKQAIGSFKVLRILLLAGILLAFNWLLFIWAVNNNYLLEASLGYYINPLINVFLGRLFLGETLRPLQKLAVGIAAVGVLVLLVNYGSLPWIALSLACSFAFYGLLRKQVAVDSMPGLFIETLMMLPIAVVYFFWFAEKSVNPSEMSLNLVLLIASVGFVTTAPLLCFTAAARRIKYSTLGFFQYIGPTIMFVLAAWLYNEPLSQARLITFLFVWSALALFTFDSINAYRKQRKEPVMRPE
ncbi:EamA family transporter RarD [Glaciecola sp. 2405UD65-10]|jgi:chloramphenicol-sensitive protein RarD|uniref:EamA family transporter RarD n=1 Tax=Glaciecola sp. 2405UD65-10 TaxID=3397244 RepID=UPI003B5AEDF8